MKNFGLSWCRGTALLLLLILVVSKAPVAGQSARCRPALSGSFLQPDLGDSWTDRQWQREFAYMKKAGVHQMVIQWTADSLEKTTIYPTKIPGYVQSSRTDVVERALQYADAAGVQIFLGLQANNDWWTNYANDQAWLQDQAKIGNRIADELWSDYGHHSSLAGWYLWFEIDNVNEPTQTQWSRLAAFLRSAGNHLHALSAGKPVMIAPFYNSAAGLSSAQWQTMWEYILARTPVDVVALQDGVGVRHARAADLPTWFAATARAVRAGGRAQLWADSETFLIGNDQPMPIHSLVTDMRAVQPYVSNYLSFSFDHYMSPQQVNPLYYKTYMNYLATSQVEGVSPSAPTALDAVAIDPTTVLLNWTASTDNFGVVGYQISRDDKVVAATFDGVSTFTDSGCDPNTTYTYQIRAFDAAGNKSALSSTATVTTPPKDPYTIDLSLGKPYTASLPADPNYPDTNAIEITDGTYGLVDYTDSAWQGRNTGSAYSVTIDLGSVENIKEVRSRWLQYDVAAIYLPKQIAYMVSNDGATFNTIGTVVKPAVSDSNQPAWYTLSDLSGVSGRFVKAEITPPSDAWTFIDEIEARQ